MSKTVLPGRGLENWHEQPLHSILHPPLASCSGSFQVHDITYKRTILAWNAFAVTEAAYGEYPADVGMGPFRSDSPFYGVAGLRTGHPDWTVSLPPFQSLPCSLYPLSP